MCIRDRIISYYVIILAVMLIFNFFVMPGIEKSRIKEVSYDEFMDMTLNLSLIHIFLIEDAPE